MCEGGEVRGERELEIVGGKGESGRYKATHKYTHHPLAYYRGTHKSKHAT